MVSEIIYFLLHLYQTINYKFHFETKPSFDLNDLGLTRLSNLLVITFK